MTAHRAARTLLAISTILIPALGAGSLPLALPAAPAAAAPAATAAAPDGTAEPRMGSYDDADFAAEAAALPDALTAAVERDLDLSPEEYLANAAASVDAAAVVDDLESQGVGVVDSRLDGTRLLVGVESEADVAAVEARGAEAVVGTAAEPEDFGASAFEPVEDLSGGSGWLHYNGTGGICSLGFAGYDKASGAARFLTAGHCLLAPSPSGAATQPAYTLRQSSPDSADTAIGTVIGSLLGSSFRYGGSYDSGLVSVTNGALVQKPQTITWGGGAGSPTAGTPVPVYGSTTATVGSAICKSGRTSGWSCGRVLATNYPVMVGGKNKVNSVVTTLCAIPGDSGGPAMTGNYAVGVASSSSFANCRKGATGHSAYFPLSGSTASALTQQSGWELAVALATPKVTPPGTVYRNGALTGTLDHAQTGTTVSLYVDGSATPVATAAMKTGVTGFSLSLAKVAPGTHSYRVVAGSGKWSRSAAATGTVKVLATPSVSRIAGADRYETAVRISQAGFPGKSDVVYLAAGENFPDALSAAPAAAKEGGPLLLTPGRKLAPVVKTELQRLKPAKIVLVGGTGVLSKAVESAVKPLTGKVVRYAGADRYATSRALVSAVFGSGVDRLYIATGATFPDALSAGAAAGASSAAVLLVPGTKPSLDKATTQLIAKLAPTSIRIAGGPGTVSAGIQSALSKQAKSVTRLGGADRYQTSQLVSANAFPSAKEVLVASGTVFPDALAGAVLAAKRTAPLLASRADCLPKGLLSTAAKLGATKVTLLGGTGPLGTRVQALGECG